LLFVYESNIPFLSDSALLKISFVIQNDTKNHCFLLYLIMLKPFGIIILPAILLVACNKDVSPLPATAITTPPPVTDSINYNDIADIYLHSIYSYQQSGSCQYPLPADTSVIHRMDLTGDGLNDISVACYTSYAGNFPSSGTTCSQVYNLNVAIGFDSSNVDGVVALQSNGQCDSLSFGEVIGSGQLFRPGGASVRVLAHAPSGGGIAYSFVSGKDTYVGILIKRNGITMYGWLLVNVNVADNGVTIKSWALNRSNNQDITAGQTN
jgi:hypothetical protein